MEWKRSSEFYKNVTRTARKYYVGVGSNGIIISIRLSRLRYLYLYFFFVYIAVAAATSALSYSTYKRRARAIYYCWLFLGIR